MKKILVTEYFNITESKNFDKIIVLNDYYLHDDPKIIKLDQNSLTKSDTSQLYLYFKKLLQRFDKNINSELSVATKINFSNAKILETNCIERLLKYSKLINAILEGIKNDNSSYYFQKSRLNSKNNEQFAYQYFYYYLKYFKKFKVFKINTQNFVYKNLSITRKPNILFFLLLCVCTYKINVLIKEKFIKYLFLFKKKEKKILFLDKTNFFNNNFNYRKKIFIENYLFKRSQIKINFKNFSTKFEKILFLLIVMNNKNYLEQVPSINNFFLKNKKNYLSVVFTYPPTIYDFFKGVCLELARLNNICRHCFQHGSDYGYHKNFIPHFLKDYNNCEVFYACGFDANVLKTNNSKILTLFNSFPKIINLKIKKFKFIWSVPLPWLSFFSKKHILYLGTVYTSLIEQEFFDQEKIFKLEVSILDSLANKGYIIIYKANKSISLSHLSFLRQRYKKIVFLQNALKSIMPLLKNIKVFSTNFSTAHIEFCTVQKKIYFIKPNKYFLIDLDLSIIKQYSS
jgi:hypothetical protein